MEASCGKNPVYHVGKVYTVLCNLIAADIYTMTGIENYVYATSQIGKQLADPWSIAIDLCDNRESVAIHTLIQDIVQKHTTSPQKITERIISGENHLY